MMTLGHFLTMTVPKFNYMIDVKFKGIDVEDLNVNPTKYQITELASHTKSLKKPYIQVDTDLGSLVITKNDHPDHHLPKGRWQRGATWSN